MAYLTSRFSQFHKLLLLFLDLFLIILSLSVSFKMRVGMWSYDFVGIYFFWIIVLLVLSSFYIFGTFEFDKINSISDLLNLNFKSLLFSFVFIGFLTFIFAFDNFGFFGRGVLLGAGVIFFILSSGPRIVIYHLERKYRKSLRWLFVVNSQTHHIIESELKKNHFQGRIVLLNFNEFSYQFVLSHKWNAIVLSVHESEISSEMTQVLMNERLQGQNIMHISDFYETFWNKVPVDILDQSWFVEVKGFSLVDNPIQLRFKRLMDLVMAMILSFFALPLMIIATFAILIETGRPIFYTQKRVGKNGREFKIYKFRSMYIDAEKNGAQWASKNDSRITRVGHWLRVTRIDELPQLINVIKGDMSFIGPRPERREFNVLIEEKVPFYNVRHLVRPGLTGWAQILFPYGSSIDDSREKLKYDLYYIKNYSFLMDISIILKTISVVLQRRGQ